MCVSLVSFVSYPGIYKRIFRNIYVDCRYDVRPKKDRCLLFMRVTESAEWSESPVSPWRAKVSCKHLNTPLHPPLLLLTVSVPPPAAMYLYHASNT